MSSNIEVQRICEQCGKEFTARTTVTRFCGKQCASRAYKRRKKEEKINKSNQETKKVMFAPIAAIQQKDILDVKDVAKLLGCSKRTIYNLINDGTIKSVNFGKRQTRIKRESINKLFE